MPICVPVKDMRDTARFSSLVETAPGPVTVTKNGYDKFVVMRSEDYDLLTQEVAKAHLQARIAVAEQERAAGITHDAYASLDAMEAKYGL